MGLIDEIIARWMPGGSRKARPKAPKRSKQDRMIIRRRRQALKAARAARRAERDARLLLPWYRPSYHELPPRLREFAWWTACGYRSFVIHEKMGITAATAIQYRYKLTKRMKMTMGQITLMIVREGIKLIEPLDYRDRVSYRPAPMAKPLDVSAHTHKAFYGILEEMDALAELAPKLVDRPKARNEVINQVNAKWKQVQEYLQTGKSPVKAVPTLPEG